MPDVTGDPVPLHQGTGSSLGSDGELDTCLAATVPGTSPAIWRTAMLSGL